MIWIILILAFFVPRLSIILLWFFSNWFSGIFNSALWPILGFIFLPATLLWYTVVFNYFDNNWTIVPVAGIIVALLIDLSPGSSKRYRKRD